MKKVYVVFIFAVVFLFNTVGFFDISQDDQLMKENMSVVYAFNQTGNTLLLNAGSVSAAGVEDDNPISKSSFAILVSSMILMLLIRSKAN